MTLLFPEMMKVWQSAIMDVIYELWLRNLNLSDICKTETTFKAETVIRVAKC